ncbi:hypothetical protein NQ318_008034 [Aromia moschata]|uniref:Uncharacterized protein n=1 Tax=Aromia moschata TaxID=1265417 RepID=A0AAV8XVV2_9CUCU|nr:hypothetical protein NQ318_008034 [Aromia moschata]
MDKKVTSFLKGENNIVNEPGTSSISNMANGKDKELPSFWIPSKTPSAEKSKLEKPDSTIYCPISHRPLKVKDLVDVKFTPVNDPNDKKSIHTRENRYMCAVTHDILSNSVPCAVLKPTGDVVTLECIEKIIKKRLDSSVDQ